MILLFRSHWDEAENVKNLEENVRHSNEIAKTIRGKVADLIALIKEEEKKLLQQVEEFQTAEQRSVSVHDRFLGDRSANDYLDALRRKIVD